MDFSQSTQARHWTFDAESLSRRRQKTRDAAVARVKAASEYMRGQGAVSAADECARGPLSVEDEVLLCAHWESKLQAVCQTENQRQPGRFTNRVLAAAQMFFKRFYLLESLISEDPKFLMLAALYLAAKVEEERITVEDLVEGYAAKLQPEALLALEMRLLQGLRFQVVTRSPFRCLAGLMHALHSSCAASTSGEEGAAASRDAHLEDLHRTAMTHVRRLLCTDAPLLFSPQLIALASLDAAGHELAVTSGIDVRGWIEAVEIIDVGGGATAAVAQLDRTELLRQMVAVEEAARASTINLSSDGTHDRVKQADKRLKELLKAVRQHNKAREEQRHAADEDEHQRRKRRKEELSKEEQERLVAALEAARPGGGTGAAGSAGSAVDADTNAFTMHNENLKRTRGADGVKLEEQPAARSTVVKPEEPTVKREER